MRNGTKVKDVYSPILSLFFEDESGSLVSDEVKDQVRGDLTAYWLNMVKEGETPCHYKGLGFKRREHYRKMMEEKYPWLRVMAMTFRTFSLSSFSHHLDSFFLSLTLWGQNLSLDQVRLSDDEALAIYSGIKVQGRILERLNSHSPSLRLAIPRLILPASRFLSRPNRTQDPSSVLGIPLIPHARSRNGRSPCDGQQLLILLQGSNKLRPLDFLEMGSFHKRHHLRLLLSLVIGYLLPQSQRWTKEYGWGDR
jgi:hypothetical protein